MKHTADLADAHGAAIQVSNPGLVHFGGLGRFGGPVRTVTVFEDNTLVRDTLSEQGEGHVLVVDGGGSTQCALLGGNLGVLARDHGWAGVIVNGYVRDSEELRALAIGVVALGVHPRRSGKTGSGVKGEAVTFLGCTYRPGEHVVVDRDGIVVGPSLLD